MEEEGARWPHRSSKPAWRLILLPEGSTPSPLRHYLPQSRRVFRASATRVPTALVQIFSDLRQRGFQFAFGADRITTVNSIAPSSDQAHHGARHARALEVPRGRAPQVM